MTAICVEHNGFCQMQLCNPEVNDSENLVQLHLTRVTRALTCSDRQQGFLIPLSASSLASDTQHLSAVTSAATHDNSENGSVHMEISITCSALAGVQFDRATALPVRNDASQERSLAASLFLCQS